MLKRQIKSDNRQLIKADFQKKKKKIQEKEYEEKLENVVGFLGTEESKLLEQLQNVKFRYKESNYKSSSLKRVRDKIELKLRMLAKHEEIIHGCNAKFIAVSRQVPDKQRESLALPLDCGSQLCPRCAANKSRIHCRKIRRIAKWLLEVRCAKGTTPMLHSYVFTLPKSLRSFFASKIMLDKLFKVASNAIMDIIGPQGTIATLHNFGDKEDMYAPHVNILFAGIDKNRNRLPNVIPKEKLKEVRESFLLEVVKLLPDEFVEQLPNDYVEKNSNCHRSFKNKKGQKLHIIGYLTRGVVDVPKLANEPQEIIDLFLYQLSPCRIDGANNSTMSGKGRGFRYTRYFGAYSCGNRKKFLEQNSIVVNEKKPFQVADDPDVDFEIVSYFGKPVLFNFYEHEQVGVHKELELPKVDLNYWFVDNLAIGGDSMV